MTRRSQEKKEEYKRGEEAFQDEERRKERSYEGSYKKGEEALQRREERERDEENKDPPCLNWGRGFEFVANLAEVVAIWPLWAVRWLGWLFRPRSIGG